MFTSWIVGTITPYSGSNTPDKNGEQSVMIQYIAGVMPNRQVLAGTVAKRAGFEIGKTYLIHVREQGYDELYGLDFNFIKINELTGVDIIKTCKEIGEPEIWVVERPEGFKEEYDRKGDAIESFRTQRIKEGKYKPSVASTVTDHRNARDVEKGSSTEGWGPNQTSKIEQQQKGSKTISIKDRNKEIDESFKEEDANK